jgi:hypothetical protein
MANERRIKNGKALVALYVQREKLEPVDAKQDTAVSDAIVDLLHYARHKGFDSDLLLRRVNNHLGVEEPKKKRICTDVRCVLPADHTGSCKGEDEDDEDGVTECPHGHSVCPIC